MKSFQLIMQRDALLVPQLVEDAFGGESLVLPDEEDVPKHILLAMHGFPADTAEVDIVYPRHLVGEEKIFPNGSGHIVIDGGRGYLKRLLAASPPPGQTHYDAIKRLLGVYRAYARILPVHDEWRWYTMFVAEIMLAHWIERENELRLLVSVPPAP